MDEIINPTPSTLAEIGERYRGRGSAGTEWCVTYCHGDDHALFYSSVGTEVYAMCKRLQGNPGACAKVRDAGDGVFFHLAAGELRKPALMVQPTSRALRVKRAAENPAPPWRNQAARHG